MKKRPFKAVYPYLCPFCDELSYPSKTSAPIIMPDKSMTMWVCPNNHTFYTYERVCGHQDWAYNVFNGIEQPIWRKKSEKWLKELQQNNYGIDDYVETEK